MLVQSTYTQGTSKEEYDHLLSCGWFRGTGVIYKSDLLCMNEQVLSTVHIRIPLYDYKPKKRHRKLLRTNLAHFKHTISTPSFDQPKEELYKKHFNRFKSFINHSLQELVTTGLEDADFETYELALYDREKLIALSYFDCSSSSAASIICVFDQSYAKRSLGIYTMLLEIEFAKSKGIKYYYPGYIMDAPSSFDYKLSLGKVQWLHPEKGWINEPQDIYNSTKGRQLREKMAELAEKLVTANLEFETRIYPFFTVAYVFWQQPDLLRFPVYIVLKGSLEFAVSFDLESEKYVLYRIVPSIEFERNNLLSVSDDYQKGKMYEMRLMKINGLKEYSTAGDLIRSLKNRIARIKSLAAQLKNSDATLNLFDAEK